MNYGIKYKRSFQKRYIIWNHIDDVLDARRAKLTEILEGSKQFRMPIYQRTYDWQKEHCRQLFDDIVNIGRGESERAHFLGTITYLSENTPMPDVTIYQIIDGQQRLTTIMLLLKALKDSFSDKDQKIMSDKINEMLFNMRDTDNNHWKVVLTEDDDEIYRKILKDKDVEKSSQIYANFQYLKKLLAENGIDYRHVWNGIRRLIVVTIMINNSDDAQAIFESMNSTGLGLSETDMIKNYLLMSYDSTTQKEIYNEYWKEMVKKLGKNDDHVDDYLRNYLMMRLGQNVTEKRTYVEFKKYMMNRDKKKELSFINDYSKYYACLVNMSHDSNKIQKAIVNIEEQETKLARPLLLRILADLDQREIDDDEAQKIFSMLDSYLIRCYICDMLKGGNKMFPSMIRKINSDYYYKSIEDELMKKRGRGRFPRNAIFKDKFIDFQLYNGRENTCRYILFRLEQKISEAHNENPSIDNKDITIEHIMPKTLTDGWKEDLGEKWEEVYERYLDTIGNLTLTGSNPKISNELFSSKKTEYIKSKMNITKRLTEYDVWNQDAIIKRAKILAEEAIETWWCPEEPDGEYDNEVEELEEDYLESREVTELWNYLKMKILTLDGTRFHMTAVYGSFTVLIGNTLVGICGTHATKHKIYLTYNTKIRDGVIPESPFVENVSEKGRYYSAGELRSIILSENDADKAMDLLKKILDYKRKTRKSRLSDIARKAVKTRKKRSL